MKKKEYLKRFLIVFLVLCISGCAPKLLIKENPSIKELAICFHSSASMADSIKTNIESTVGKFINDYNAENRKFKLIPCQNDDARTLNLDLLRISITDPGKQAAGVVVTTIGTITPFVMLAAGAPFIVWFAYLPNSSMQTALSLSKDIARDGTVKKRNMFAGSNKYFGSFETQKTLLLNHFYRQLFIELSKIESRYK